MNCFERELDSIDVKDFSKKHIGVPFNYVITSLNKSLWIYVDLGVFRALHIDVTLEGARQVNNTRYKEGTKTKYMLAQMICLIGLKSKILRVIYVKAVTEYKNAPLLSNAHGSE